ncbi:MAG TPA: VCBS repeat-containing protein, partial [Puia sp.]|nr:VCBS repeat-containing protein [Puia sp.]
LLDQKNAIQIWIPAPILGKQLFTDVTSSLDAIYKHTEAVFNDFAEQRLLLQKYSQLGPFISTGDINRDGLKDFFIGGAFNFSGKVFLQEPKGRFSSFNISDSIKFQEDVCNTLFDADGDGDLDLLIAYGDTRYNDTSIFYHPRLYINDGHGHFTLKANAIPDNVKTIAGCMEVADFDGDGKLDVFIGGRVSKQFPLSPRSYLLKNNGGTFTDVTSTVCLDLEHVGMVTAAQWTDIDGDKNPDLVIAGEFMPIRFFRNDGKKFYEITSTTGLQNTSGMWRSLVAEDVDGDGDIDFIAGNLGSNCIFHTTEGHPMKIYADDIDHNGSIDPVMFYYIVNDQGKKDLYPAISRDQLASQVPAIKKKFLLNKDYAGARPGDIFPEDKNLLILSCNETRSCWIENKGNGKFELHALPQEAQFAPVN